MNLHQNGYNVFAINNKIYGKVFFFSFILKVGNYFAILTTYKLLQCFKEIIMEYGSLEYPYSSLSNKVWENVAIYI